jgi:Uma2 family endonuclease
MIRSGVLKSGDPIELLEGWLVNKMIKNPPHRVAVRKCRIVLERLLPAQWSLDIQEPITTADSEPEPDISVIRGDTTALLDRHPGPDEIGLLVEVAEASLERDRGWKKRVYATAAIRVYWIVNLVDRQVETFTGPSGPGERPDYGTRQVFLPGDQVPFVLDGTEVGRIAVDDLLP